MYQTQMRPHLFEHAHRRLVVRIAHETCVIAPAAIISNIRWASRDCRATTALGFCFPAAHSSRGYPSEAALKAPRPGKKN
jgi:hypothetical protein